MTVASLDSRYRAIRLEKAGEEPFDLLVIGGGITGAGVALDAVVRGMKVCLVEMGDFASGTSSRSTRLIHGGLRYLRQFEFALVRETGSERAVLHQIAPHLIWPGPMLLPSVKNGAFSRLGLRLGLCFYDRLAGVHKSERHRMLNTENALATEPLLRKENLRGAGLYLEYRTDDARLTLALVKTAVTRGAMAFNYCTCRALNFTSGGLATATVKDELGGNEYKIAARAVVNATGPWVKNLAALDAVASLPPLALSKGSHIVVKSADFSLRQPVYFDSPDKRLIFAIPDGDLIYIGTTDAPFSGDLSHPVCTAAEADYLLAAVSGRFKVKLTRGQILSCWAGVRPLIAMPGKSTSETSRRDEIIKSPSGMLTIAGGKLTGYRKMARRTVDKVIAQLRQSGIEFSGESTDTKNIRVSDADFPAGVTPENFAVQLQKDFSFLSAGVILEYVKKFGTGTTAILQQVKEKINQNTSSPGDALLLSAFEFCLVNEAICTADDFLVRRMHVIYRGREYYQHCLSVLKPVLPQLPVSMRELPSEAEEYLPTF